MKKEEAIEMLKALNMMLRNPNDEPISDVCEAIDMAIEALSEPINCVKCKQYYETEDDTDVHGHCKVDTSHAIKHSTAYMHDDLYEAISIRIPSTDKPNGKWERLIEYMPESDEGLITFDGYQCSVCGVKMWVDDFEFWDYCPNCGATMENKE